MDILFDGDVNQNIAGETTPSLELGTKHAIGTGDRNEIARIQRAPRGNQFYKQASRKCFSARVELDMGS
jgi:hypothetical protein